MGAGGGETEDGAAVDLRVRPVDFAKALAFATVLAVVVAVVVGSMVEPAPETPVARVTTEDLEAMADMARAIIDDPAATRAERRTARRLAEVVDAVENGEVEVVPNTTAAAASPVTSPPPPPPATTRPTTTTATTTTAPPPATAPPWPGVHDAPRVLPPVTLPDLPALPVP